MGERGPIASSTSRRGARRGEVVPTTTVATIGPAPVGLGVAGFATWGEVAECPWVGAPDRGMVELLAELADERERLRAEVHERGLALERPVQTATGKVVGSELYGNPLLKELRRVEDGELKLRDRLGLSPQARARLGLVTATAASVAAKLDRDRSTNALMAKYRAAAAGRGADE